MASGWMRFPQHEYVNNGVCVCTYMSLYCMCALYMQAETHRLSELLLITQHISYILWMGHRGRLSLSDHAIQTLCLGLLLSQCSLCHCHRPVYMEYLFANAINSFLFRDVFKQWENTVLASVVLSKGELTVPLMPSCLDLMLAGLSASSEHKLALWLFIS